MSGFGTSHSGNNDYQRGEEDERERIADWLEIHSIDWDCAVLVYDASDYDADYCDAPGETDEFKEKACQRRTLADIIRRNLI